MISINEHKDKNCTIIIDTSLLNLKCHKISNSMSVFLEFSLSDLVLTWRQYSLSIILSLRKMISMYYSLNIYHRFIKSEYKRWIETDCIQYYYQHILDRNRLIDQIQKLTKEYGAIDKIVSEKISKDYKILINDLQSQLSHTKSMFKEMRIDVIDSMHNIVKSATNLQRVPLQVKKYVSNSIDETVLENSKCGNEIIRKNIIVNRILRVFSRIAQGRFLNKRLNAVEEDRRAANILLWSNRLYYESHVQSMERNLDSLRNKLSNSENEMEKVRQRLNNEKESNIMFVQWKATNVKILEELRSKMNSLRKTAGFSIGDMLNKLNEAHNELNELYQESNSLDTSFINETMYQSMRTRTASKNTRIEKISPIQMLKSIETQDHKKQEEANSALEENRILKRQNELLKLKILQAEQQKLKKPNEMVKFMEKTVKPPGIRPKTGLIHQPKPKTSTRASLY